MNHIDSTYDLWRIGNLIVGLLCVIWLFGGLKRQRAQWNTKTRDLWYSRILWAVIQCVLSLEGLYYDRGFNYSLGLITVAGLVTFKGLNTKGSWGYNADV